MTLARPAPHADTEPRGWMARCRAGLTFVLLAGAIVGAGAAVVIADSREVTVTRESRNLYRIDGTNTLIKTFECYEYAFSEEAVLDYERDSGENSLYFVYSAATCDVERLIEE